MCKFTKLEQADHCVRLATLIERSNPEMYNHEHFEVKSHKPCGTVACALGWAAIAGIGGLKMEHGFPTLRDGQAFDVLSHMSASDVVFGKDAYEEIFSSYRDTVSNTPFHGDTDDHGRADSIMLLHKRAAKLIKEHEDDITQNL